MIFNLQSMVLNNKFEITTHFFLKYQVFNKYYDEVFQNYFLIDFNLQNNLKY